MPRKSLEQSLDCSCLVSLRRKTRTGCFGADDDYLFFLNALADAVKRHSLQCHGYSLLPDEAQFMLSDQQEGLPARLLREVTQRYDIYFSRRYQAPEQGWSAIQYKVDSSPLSPDPELWVLNGLRYLEMAPVRAGLAQHPADYEWSSYRAHAYGEPTRVLTDHAVLRKMHRDLEERRFRYRTLFEQDMTPNELLPLQAALEHAAEVNWSTHQRASPLETALDVA